jgi:hypothetical protein
MVKGLPIPDPAPHFRGGNGDRGNGGRASDQRRVRERLSRPSKDHDPGQASHFRRLLPAVQIPGGVRSQEHHPLLSWFPDPQVPKRVHGVTGSRSLQLDRFEFEAGVARDGQFHHSSSRVGAGPVSLLEGLLSRDDESDFGKV